MLRCSCSFESNCQVSKYDTCFKCICSHMIITWSLYCRSHNHYISAVYQLSDLSTTRALWVRLIHLHVNEGLSLIFCSVEQITITVLRHHLYDDSKLLEVSQSVPNSP
jgi:hypothetical protein